MNHCYRLVFNKSSQVWQVVSELAKSHSKSAAVVLLPLFSLLPNMNAWADPALNALPTGGQVISGQSAITQNGSQLNILQSTQKSIINWNTYNIGANAQVTYVQPNANAISLNRVISGNPSEIFGKLNSNGQVWLINPNGVLFGKNAQVNVGGIVATSLNIADEDFLNGKYQFTGNAGSVINMGSIVANNGGYVAMLAPEVRNEGVISAMQGTVTMAAGNAMTLDFNGNGLINVQVDSTNINTLVENKHLIQVGNGQVLMSAKAADGLITSVINNSGRIEANSMVSDGGVIRLTGAKTVINSGEISATSSSQKGGTVHLLGDNVGMFGASRVNVSGKTGGGTILVGGDYQGKNANIQNAQKTFVSQNAKLSADATDTGDGGKVIVWADDTTRFYGSISTKGGALSGNGGFVEVSGKKYLDYIGKIDVTAFQGVGGKVFFDPLNIVLNTTTQTAPSNSANGTPDVAFADAPVAGTTFIQISDITGYSEAFFQATNDITVASAITMATNNSIKLEAGNNITVTGAIATTGTGMVTLKADADNSGAGNVVIGANITTQGGDLTLTGHDIIRTTGNIATTGAAGSDAGDISIAANNAVLLGSASITANGGTSTGVGRAGGIVNITANAGIETGAIFANASNASVSDSNGGNAGFIAINNLVNGDIKINGSLSARTGTSTGTVIGIGGVAGKVEINNQANGGNVTTGAITLSAQNKANGGSVLISAKADVTVNGSINTSANTTPLNNIAGRNAGNITITGVNRTVTGAITANGGAGGVTDQAGGNAGVVSIMGTGTLATVAVTASTGAATGTGAGGAVGSITLSGTAVSTGALTTTGAANGNAGNISISGTGTVNLGAAAIAANGGTATAGNAGRNGGVITISGAGVTTTGTKAASGSAGNGVSQAGGNAGSVNITSTNGMSVGAITASGGTAGTGNANAGNAGTIVLTNDSAGNIVAGALTARTGVAVGTGIGGATGSIAVTNTAATGGLSAGAINTQGNTKGNGGNIIISSEADITVASINTNGGTAVAGNAGQHAGDITITGVNRTITGAITASGSAGGASNQAGGNAGVVSITGTGTLSTVAITARTGNATGTGAGGLAGGVTLSGSQVTSTAIDTSRGTNGTGGNVNITTTGSATSSIASINANNLGVININNADTLTVSGVIAGAGTAVTKSGVGSLIYAGANTYTGGTVVNAGILQIGNGATSGSIVNAGNITNNATVVFNRSDTHSYGGAVSGAGAVEKDGAGEFTFSGSNTYTGATNIKVGILKSNSAISNVSAVNISSGATLDLNNLSEVVGSIAGAGNIVMGTAALTSGGNNTSTTFSGVISGTAGNFNKAGSGTLTLSGNNTYVGATNVQGGTLSATHANALGATTGGTVVASGSILNVNNVTLAAEAINLASTASLTGTDAAIVTGNVTASDNSKIGTTSDASTLTINGVLTSAANNTLEIIGAGSVVATNAANNIDIVKITNAKDVSFRDVDSMRFSATASNLTGTLTANAANDITLQAGGTIASSAGDILLTSNAFINNAGASALTALAGRWIVHTATLAGNTYGALNSGNQAIYGRALGVATTETGNRYVFVQSPTLDITSTDQTKTYGQDVTALITNAYTATPFINAATYGNVFTQDTAANSLTGSATSVGSAVATNVGSYAIDVTPITATTGYTLNKSNAGNLTVTAAVLPVSPGNASGNISVFNNAITRSEQAELTCPQFSGNQSMINGLDAFGADNVDYEPSISQPLVGGVVANALTATKCLKL